MAEDKDIQAGTKLFLVDAGDYSNRGRDCYVDGTEVVINRVSTKGGTVYIDFLGGSGCTHPKGYHVTTRERIRKYFTPRVSLVEED